MKKLFFALTIFAFLFCNIYADDDWAQKFPTTKPSARNRHAMAYIGEDKILLFGGYDGSQDNETWIYDLSDNSWTQKYPTSNPSARERHAIAYIGGDQVVLFGGWDGSNDNETWIYDLSDNSWTQKYPASTPSGRWAHAMAYIGGDQVLLFGGNDDRNDETWIYDLSDNNWTQKSPTTKPSARYWHKMAYIGGDEVILFGGWDDDFRDDETWIYDLSDNTWAQKNPTTKPSERFSHAMAYIGGDQVFLFGGDTNSGTNNETWIYDLSDNTWSKDLNTTQPTARLDHEVSETSMDGSSYLVLFGGDAGGNTDETWTFGGGDYPIPVELTAFTATVSDGVVVLNWTTQTETENFGFHVYRSQFEDRDYVKITQSIIPGAGSSEVVHHYSYTDATVELSKTYYYKLASLDYNGNVDYHGPISATVTGIISINNSNLPDAYILKQNYPNPFNPETTIRFAIKKSGFVMLKIYNLQGKLIKTLADDIFSIGSYSVTWDSTDEKGNSVSSNIYLYNLKVNNFTQTNKLIFLK